MILSRLAIAFDAITDTTNADERKGPVLLIRGTLCNERVGMRRNSLHDLLCMQAARHD
jgi:hypothetical protein